MSDNGFMPQNLSLFGRASLLVVFIELLTATTGLIRSVSKLVHYELNSERDSVYLFVCILSIILYCLIFILDFLLYFGVRKGRVRLLASWYKVGIFILMLGGVGAIITAIADEDGIKSTGDYSYLIIRVFEIWVVYEYCKELESGYIPQADLVP